MGYEHGESDLDLAILAPRPLENLDRWNRQEKLAVHLGRNVDLVDLRSASTVMQMQVLSRGAVLAEWDRAERQRFEMQVYSAYALLNEERAGILDDAGHLDAELSDRLQRMVGFRNVAVHDYRELNLDIVQAIVEKHLSDFTQFTEWVLKTDDFQPEK